MKRTLVLPSLALAAVFVITSFADGQVVPLRAATQQVTATTVPARDRTRPYTFTTTGKMVPPPACAAGVIPTVAGGNCLPQICPPVAVGAKNPGPIYCVPPANAVVCTGRVTVRVKKRGHRGGPFTISSRQVGLRADCTYQSHVSFRTRVRTRRGLFTVHVRFEGNPLLLPKSAPVQSVRAG